MDQDWRAFPYPDRTYRYTPSSLKTAWKRLHVGDCEPWPDSPALIDAWIAFHAGEFRRAADAGIDLGVSGFTVANKAQAVYATHLAPNEARLSLLDEVAQRALSHQARDTENANAHYARAYAVGRYAQEIPVLDALSRGLVGEVKSTLEHVVRVKPAHADAHVALGVCHAQIVSKVGALIGAISYGASNDASDHHFEVALSLAPERAIVRIEYARALALRKDASCKTRGAALLHQARACEAHDATERLDLEHARTMR